MSLKTTSTEGPLIQRVEAHFLALPINQFFHSEQLKIPWDNTNGATVAIFEFPLLTTDRPNLRFELFLLYGSLSQLRH